jgi:hypothetical protein
MAYKGKKGTPTDVEYLLQINHAGRYLLETNGIGNNRNNRNSTDNSGGSGDGNGGIGNRPVPLSLWPLILERSYSKSDKMYGAYPQLPKTATGMYYLLRNGPALSYRTNTYHHEVGFSATVPPPSSIAAAAAASTTIRAAAVADIDENKKNPPKQKRKLK